MITIVAKGVLFATLDLPLARHCIGLAQITNYES